MGKRSLTALADAHRAGKDKKPLKPALDRKPANLQTGRQALVRSHNLIPSI
jgi:hypothetical protein